MQNLSPKAPRCCPLDASHRHTLMYGLRHTACRVWRPRCDAAGACRAPHIKAMGVTVLPELAEPEDEDNPPTLLPEQTEQGPRLLAPASEDARGAAATPAWAALTSSCSRTVQHQVAGVRSVVWPGALAVSNGKTWANVYVGWGVKRGVGSAAVAECVMQAEPVLPSERNELPPPPAKEDADEEEE